MLGKFLNMFGHDNIVQFLLLFHSLEHLILPIDPIPIDLVLSLEFL